MNTYISGKRIVWQDEGLALLFSGEKAGMTKEKIVNMIKEINNTKDSIDVSKLAHNSSFVKLGVYNGYDISYMMVKYIFETMNKEEIVNLFINNEYVENIQNKIFEEALEYFNSIEKKN